MRFLKNSESRLAAVQAIYLLEITYGDEAPDKKIRHIDRSLQSVILNCDLESAKKIKIDFIKELLIKVIEDVIVLEKLINNNLTKQDSLKKLNILLKFIIECAICELLYFDTPYKVVINEYVKLTTNFFSEGEVNFANAILDKISKQLGKESNASEGDERT